LRGRAASHWHRTCRGAGLFGHALAELVGKPATRTRKVATEMLRIFHAAQQRKK